MLDIKLIREDVEEVIRRLNTRGGDFSYLRELKAKDERKRELLVEVENLKSERNQKSHHYAVGKRAGRTNGYKRIHIGIAVDQSIEPADEQIAATV